jgi:hypothetical protein
MRWREFLASIVAGAAVGQSLAALSSRSAFRGSAHKCSYNVSQATISRLGRA